MKDLVQYLAKSLVNNPEAVEVTETTGDDGSTLKIRVAKEDLGRIIGKQGVTINAIRSLLQAGSARKGMRCMLEVVESHPAG